jgi:hypothetical protein
MLPFWGGKHIQAFILGTAPSSKNIGAGPIKWLIPKTEIKDLVGIFILGANPP